MSMRRWILLLLLACFPPATVALELELESHCLDCHRPTQMRGEVPLIEGQQGDYLRRQLADFRDLHRHGFPMTGLAAGMDNEAIMAIVDALAARPWRRSARPVSRKAAERGRKQSSDLECVSCHGESFLGSGSMPRLAGQQPGYLRRQIRAFADGERQHPLSEVDARIYILDDEQVRDIAAFLHSLP